MQDKLSVVVADTGMELEKAKSIWVQFEDSFEAINACAEKVRGLEITDISQKEEMKLARSTRLELKRIRVDAEKKKKELKDGILKEGRFIDATLKLITDATRPVEANLLDMENFAKRKEAERLAQLKQDRLAELAPYDVDTQFIDFVQMTDDEFSQLLEKSRVAYRTRQEREQIEREKRIERERREEEARIAREKEEADRRAKAEAEIERLRKEQEERERELKRQQEEERKRFEEEKARIRQEQEEREREREKIRAEERAREEAERKKEREEIARQLAEERAVAEKARQEAEESARKEREAREEMERKERELREKQEAEELARREEDERRIKLEQASDKEKLSAYLNTILALNVPSVDSQAAMNILNELRFAIQEAITDTKTL
jgi:hypothetical protein